LRVGAERHDVLLPTVHDVAVTNLLLAASAVIALGGEPEVVVGALAGVAPPPGRLEVVGVRDGVTAMVDTAHNPAALRTALTSVRARTEGRVLLVVGAGGERDRAKRAPMGEIAAELADLVVLTDDNPRREPPGRIRAEVREGCPDCLEIPRRADAIRAAWEMAREGDVVLVAGKGDETVQLVGTRRIPHDDRVVLRQLVTRD
jgi:UDP-N-acetylmuramoyl-L-alanyl-D-glutamate--2,6-diaminopimelate ligase